LLKFFPNVYYSYGKSDNNIKTRTTIRTRITFVALGDPFPGLKSSYNIRSVKSAAAIPILVLLAFRELGVT